MQNGDKKKDRSLANILESVVLLDYLFNYYICTYS